MLVTELRGTQQKFKDPDFVPSQSLIFNQNDSVPARDEVQIEMLKWMRPEEISIKSDIVGFYEINESRASKQEISGLAGLELADGHRISYGQTLEDRWFLNALTMVAAEERQLDLMTC